MSPFGVSLNDTVNETGMLIGNTSENDETATNDRASSEFSVTHFFSPQFIPTAVSECF